MDKLFQFLETLPKWTLSVICLVAILWLTLASKPLGDNDIQLFPHADKLAHAVMFGGFTFCILIDSMRRNQWRIHKLPLLFAPLAASLLGLITEFLQQAMHAGRSGDPFDLLADAAGSFIVAAAFFFFGNHSRFR